MLNYLIRVVASSCRYLKIPWKKLKMEKIPSLVRQSLHNHNWLRFIIVAEPYRLMSDFLGITFPFFLCLFDVWHFNRIFMRKKTRQKKIISLKYQCIVSPNEFFKKNVRRSSNNNNIVWLNSQQNDSNSCDCVHLLHVQRNTKASGAQAITTTTTIRETKKNEQQTPQHINCAKHSEN